MSLSPELAELYTAILRAELVPAMGCTEPIAIAYAAAKAREVLDCTPVRAELVVSNNIIKNVKSVVVPNTDGLKGLEAAVAAGAAAGDASQVLQVISRVDDAGRKAIRKFLQEVPICVHPAQSDEIFDILVELKGKTDQVRVRITSCHTNIVLIEKNGQALFQGSPQTDESHPDGYEQLNVRDILEYAETVPLEPVAPILERQITYNTAISQAGLTGRWGAAIGKTLLDMYGNDVTIRARAAAAAGSDARMSGCEKPVIINSGSGNQGMTASLPVIAYAQELGKSHQELLRALLLSNLLTLHLKTGIGRLSAYCGAVCAGCAAGSAIAWLNGGDYQVITHTLVNSLAIASGIICDGAKPSCAAKISCAVDAGLLGWQMYLHGHQFYGGEGIVQKGVEETILSVGRLGREGMRDTDHEIIRIMTGQ